MTNQTTGLGASPERPIAKVAPATLPQNSEISERDFGRMARIVNRAVGIELEQSKRVMIQARLRQRLAQLNIGSFDDYLSFVSGPSGGEELAIMVAALTTGTTRFFREKHHFDHMTLEALPPLVSRARKGGRVRIWSAGCSRGHEAYSVGLTVLSQMSDANEFDVRILATDINVNNLRQAHAGEFRDDEFSPVVAESLENWFERDSAQDVAESWIAGKELRELMTFLPLNLVGEWPMTGKFDIIFCRNVLMYFSVDFQQLTVERLADALAPSGYLYLGHSEHLREQIAGLQTVRNCQSTYRCKDRWR